MDCEIILTHHSTIARMDHGSEGWLKLKLSVFFCATGRMDVSDLFVADLELSI